MLVISIEYYWLERSYWLASFYRLKLLTLQTYISYLVQYIDIHWITDLHKTLLLLGSVVTKWIGHSAFNAVVTVQIRVTLLEICDHNWSSFLQLFDHAAVVFSGYSCFRHQQKAAEIKFEIVNIMWRPTVCTPSITA